MPEHHSMQTVMQGRSESQSVKQYLYSAFQQKVHKTVYSFKKGNGMLPAKWQGGVLGQVDERGKAQKGKLRWVKVAWETDWAWEGAGMAAEAATGSCPPSQNSEREMCALTSAPGIELVQIEVDTLGLHTLYGVRELMFLYPEEVLLPLYCRADEHYRIGP